MFADVPLKQFNPSFYSQFLSVLTIIHHPGIHPGKEEEVKDTSTENSK